MAAQNSAIQVTKVPEWCGLYATTQSAAIRETFETVLNSLELAVSEPHAGVLHARCSQENLAQLSLLCEQHLSAGELIRIRCQLVDQQYEPSVAELMHARSLAAWKAWIDGQWLGEMLNDRRLLTYFQPIVNNVNPSEVFAYECLIRGVDKVGEMVMPGRILNAARATGMMREVDCLAQLTAVNTATRVDLKSSVFINFNPRFIDHPEYLAATLEAVKNSPIPSHRFVFEVVESDEIVAIEKLLEVLKICRDAGCGVALDDLGAGYSSLNLMAVVQPDFVKLDMDLIRNVDQDIYKSCVAAKLLELAAELDVATVVEGVETVGEWYWAIDHGANYAQGYLFARPAAEPPIPRVPPARVLDLDAAADGTFAGASQPMTTGQTFST